MKRKIILLLIIIFIVTGISLYLINKENDQESENIKIDEYNFSQLEKAKPILESISKGTEKFYTLKEFNSLYKKDIKPTKNCYYVSNDNGNEKYIFGFKLESKKYKDKYQRDYYVYPKYDLPYIPLCYGYKYNTPCIDRNITRFEGTISNPCED